MLGTFILGVAAGWLAPQAEPRIRSVLDDVLSEGGPLDPLELRMLSLALSILVAAILSMILADPNVIALSLGTVLGVLGPRLLNRFRKGHAPDYDS